MGKKCTVLSIESNFKTNNKNQGVKLNDDKKLHAVI